MAHSISEVSRLAGVSSRTLRHYDAIGLLTPDHVGSNGYRYYGRPELLRLQRILLLRRLGMGLPEIAEVLVGQVHETTALRSHREELVVERDRLSILIGTVDRTIDALGGGPQLEVDQFFRGLREGREALRTRLAAKFGPGVDAPFDRAEAATAGWTVADHEDAAAEGRELLGRMSAARLEGATPGSDRAQDLVAEHHAGVSRFWEPDSRAYRALGQLYLDDEQQRGWVADVDSDLPPWLAAAIGVYAEQRLAT